MLMGNSMYPRFVNGKKGLEVFNGMSDVECRHTLTPTTSRSGSDHISESTSM